MTRFSKLFQLFNIIAFALTLLLVVPMPSVAEARCGVGCTYNIARQVASDAAQRVINYLGNGFKSILENLHSEMRDHITAEFDKMREQDSTERQLVSDSIQVNADKQIATQEADNSNRRQGVRQAYQANIEIASQGGVETVCPAMSRMQNVAAAKVLSDHMEVTTEVETTNLNTGVTGYFGASSPLDFDVNNAKQALYFTNPQSYNGGASMIASVQGKDGMLNKASFPSFQSNAIMDENVHKASSFTIGGADAEDIDLDIRPAALLDRLAIPVGSDTQKAFTILTNHVGGGPNSPIAASSLQNASSQTLQALNQSRSFTGFQNIGLMPFIRAMADRLTSSVTSPAEAVPVLDAMMDDLQFPDELKSKYKQDDRYSYASMRDLIAYFPVFNPKEFASIALWGSNNSIRRSLLYQGFNVAFTVELIKKMEMNNMLLGSLLLRDLNRDDRRVVDAMIGNGNLRLNSAPSIESNEKDMKQFINAAIRGMGDSVSAPTQASY